MKTGLLGYPIEHSLSPCMHNAAYGALGLDWEYGLYACEDAAAFNAFVAAAAADPAFIGCNVTMPYKQEAFALCDSLSPAAQTTGGVNVLTFAPIDSGQKLRFLEGFCPENSENHPENVIFDQNEAETFQKTQFLTRTAHILGASTDGAGIVASLERDGGVHIPDARVLICGTGPTAAAALVALVEARAASITVLSRDPQRAQALVDSALHHPALDATPIAGTVGAAGYDEAPGLFPNATVLVDATSLGMRAGDPAVVPVELLGPRHTVLDVVYGQGQTALLRGAQAAGAKAFDGLGMLVEQAALTIELWARAQGLVVQAPRAVMLQAARDTLVARTR